MEIDHVGVATDDLESIAELFADLLGTPLVHEEEFEGMHVAFLDAGGGYLELIEPLDGGAIADFLEREGPGVHHVALETDDLEMALATARELGVELVDEAPRPGARGHDVAFLHPRSTGGVLVELVEH